MFSQKWCTAPSSIFPLRAALWANFDVSKFHMTMIHFCRLLERIVLGSADTRIRHFRMTFKLPCGSLASQIDYRKDLDFWEIRLAEMSKSHPGRRLDCFTLQLAFLRPSWTYSGLKLNRIVVQSTLLHFSSESSPSGKFWHFQISHDHDTLLQVIGDNCLGKCWHQNSSF